MARSQVGHCAALAFVMTLVVTVVFSLVAGPVSAEEDLDEIDLARATKIRELIKKRQPTQARALARVLVAENPKSATAWLFLGATYTTRKEDWSLAEEAFQRAHKLDDTNPEPLRNLAGLQQRRGDHDEAADTILRAAELDEENIELQVLAGQLLFKARRIEEAKDRYSIVLNADPTNLLAVTGYGSLLSNMGEYTPAIEAYKAALDAGQDHPLLYYNLANSLVHSARYEEALVATQEGLDKKPEDGGLKTLRGEALVQLGRHAEAETLLGALTETMGDGDAKARPMYSLGLARSLQGCNTTELAKCDDATSPDCCEKNKQALEAFQWVYEKDNEWEDITIRLGLAQFAAGQLEDAEATLKNYVDNQGDKVEAEAFGALAVVLYAWGEERDIEEAMRLYREARELAPDFDSDDRLTKFRDWPPYAVQSITEIRKLADEADAKAKEQAEEGCGCSMVRTEPTDMGIGSALLLIAGLILVRRRRHA